jgi:fructose-specific phosphotransferase system IIC component
MSRPIRIRRSTSRERESVQPLLSANKRVVCFLVTGAVVTAGHTLMSVTLDFASYWWMNRLTWPSADLGLNLLFFLLPLLASILAVLAIRRPAFFPVVAAGSLAVHGLVRFFDEVSDLSISRVAGPSEMSWLAPCIVYGVVAGVGPALGLLAAGKFEDWKKRGMAHTAS